MRWRKSPLLPSEGDAAVSRSRARIPDVNGTTPYAVCISTPNGDGTPRRRHRFAIGPIQGHLVLAKHICEIPIRRKAYVGGNPRDPKPRDSKACTHVLAKCCLPDDRRQAWRHYDCIVGPVRENS